jgi:predicted transcriptional regulator
MLQSSFIIEPRRCGSSLDKDGAEVKGDLNAKLCQMQRQFSDLKVNISYAIVKINDAKE